jgi:hypothetical protein
MFYKKNPISGRFGPLARDKEEIPVFQHGVALYEDDILPFFQDLLIFFGQHLQYIFTKRQGLCYTKKK